LPAVVLVHGSGPSDMDETAMAYKPFFDIAEYLTSQGIAVLRYNKRTFTYGQKIVADSEYYKSITINEETIDDALLAVKLLKADKRINAEKVFVIGHSLGGMVLPRIENEGGDLAGLIIMAGSLRRLAEIMYDQSMKLGVNATSEQIAAFETLMNDLNSLKDMSNEEAKQVDVGGIFGYYFKDLDDYPYSEVLKNTTKPVLIMQGGKDFQVYVEPDFNMYKEVLQDKNNVTFKLYPNLNHFFINSKTGSLDEYYIPSKVRLKVLQDIAAWINSNL
jgi:dipeptidyl aminopeptidase/acylaminoacyl peptidase